MSLLYYKWMGGKEQEEEQEEAISRELRKCVSKVMGKGKFKNTPTGERQSSTTEEILAGTSTARPATFQKRSEEFRDAIVIDNTQEYEVIERSDGRKGFQNPNLAKPMNVKLKKIDFGKQTELSRRERGDPRAVDEVKGTGENRGSKEGIGTPVSASA